MATIKDVARLAGVSVSTISKYLNGGNVLEENAEAIRRAISELDYRVNPFARSLKTQRSKSIGVLLPDITAPFFGNVLTAMDKVLRENGYHSLISCYSSNHGLERDNLSFLLSAGIDGLIYAPEDLSVDEFYELISGSADFSKSMPKLQALMNDAWVQSAAFKHPSFASEKESRLVVSPFISNEFAVEPKYHVTMDRIKKYYPLNLNRMCSKLNMHLSDLVGEIIIGPTSSQSIPILQDYLADCGLNVLNNKICMSNCPLRKPTS